jgi:hypothetical protein
MPKYIYVYIFFLFQRTIKYKGGGHYLHDMNSSSTNSGTWPFTSQVILPFIYIFGEEVFLAHNCKRFFCAVLYWHLISNLTLLRRRGFQTHYLQKKLGMGSPVFFLCVKGF